MIDRGKKLRRKRRKKKREKKKKRAKPIDKLCLNCYKGEVVGIYYDSPEEVLYYECTVCEKKFLSPEGYDKRYEKEKDEIILGRHEEFAESKTEEEKREMLEKLLNSTPGGQSPSGGLSRNSPVSGAVIIEPEVVPTYGNYAVPIKGTNMYGYTERGRTEKCFWYELSRNAIMKEERYESVTSEILKFPNDRDLSPKQEAAKEIMEENYNTKIKTLLEKVHDEVFEQDLRVHGIRSYKSSDSGLDNFKMIFSYPDLEIIKVGTLFR